jgi:hypothetical protein
VRVRAIQSSQLSAAVVAIREIGVLSGHRVQRKAVGAPGEFEATEDGDPLTALRERFARL